MLRAWYDCQQMLNQQAQNGYNASSASASGDETVVLPPLPAPCYGEAQPRMAIMDVVILRTDETTGGGFGVNLLDDLHVFISRTVNTVTPTNHDTTSPRTGTITNVLSLGATAGAGVAYSLNVANAADQHADVMARPSLIALDRQAASFFSGSIVSVALVGQYSSNIADKPVGISMSVAPTFIDDDTMLVSVKAVRSFFEETASSATFDQSLQTTRNMVVANVRMRFNETLILSGLTEQETTQTSSGVPLLRDIPIMQYLFQRSDKSELTKSVLILLTPRRTSTFTQAMDAMDGDFHGNDVYDDESPMVREARKRAVTELGGMWPNLHHALHSMHRNELFRGIRTGDLHLEQWDERTRLQRMLNDAGNLLAR
jgi:type II secretory pathway component GspD/PulD (secretin)